MQASRLTSGKERRAKLKLKLTQTEAEEEEGGAEVRPKLKKKEEGLKKNEEGLKKGPKRLRSPLFMNPGEGRGQVPDNNALLAKSRSSIWPQRP